MSTSGISSNTKPISTVPLASSHENDGKVRSTPEPNTEIKEVSHEESLNKASDKSRTAAILQNTYFFNETEARQMSAFAKAANEMQNPNISAKVNPGFLTKIKSLCAKILTFFGDKSGEVRLRKEGTAVFKELKGAFLDPQNRDFTLNFLNQNVENPDALRGFARILGVIIPEEINIKSMEDFYGLFVNPQPLKGAPDAKVFLEQVVLPLSKEEVQAELEKNLEKPAEELVKVFPKTVEELRKSAIQIFKDLGRDFTLKIPAENIEISIPKDASLPEGVSSGTEWAFLKFQESIKGLSDDKQNKIREFCKNFPTQGVLILKNHPRLQQQARIDGETTHLDVHFSEENVHVCVTAGDKNGVKQHYFGSTGFITANISTPPFSFEFDYHPEDGSSSKVNVVGYSGQTVKIVSGYGEGIEINF